MNQGEKLTKQKLFITKNVMFDDMKVDKIDHMLNI